MRDPTYREMFDYLAGNSNAESTADMLFEIEEAIYWFANDWHGGQWSNLYSALSTSEYSPGPLRNAPETPYLYDMLVKEYAE